MVVRPKMEIKCRHGEAVVCYLLERFFLLFPKGSVNIQRGHACVSDEGDPPYQRYRKLVQTPYLHKSIHQAFG